MSESETIAPGVLDLTVITSTLLPERRASFEATQSSLDVQEVAPGFRFVGVNSRDRTMMSMYNRLAAKVDTTWLYRQDDDDLMDTRQFAVLGPHLTDDVDIVYSWCRLEGTKHPEDALQLGPFDEATFRAKMWESNFVPGSAAIRTELWNYIGGYKDPNPGWAFEDWHFWIRALKAGARFRCVPEVTWTYRPNWGSE